MNRQNVGTKARPAWIGSVSAEVLKLWSLLSNRILLIVPVVMIAGSGGMLAIGMVGRLTDERFAGQEITATPIQFVDSVLWAQIVVAIVAVLAVTNEYTSGQVWLSLLALPTRIPWLGAKALVLGVAGFLVGVIGSAIALGLSAIVLTGTDVGYEVSFEEAALLSVKSGLYLAVIAIFSIGVTALIRHVVAALIAVLALLIVLPPVLSSIPGVSDAVDYLPTIAGRRLISEFETVAQLTPWAGFGVLTVWAIAVLVLSAVLLKTRDA
jgi:ABC-2 type transport system permease protein